MVYIETMYHTRMGFPDGSVVKNPPANAGDAGSISGSGRSPGESNVSPLLGWGIFLPEASHGQRNMAGYSPWGPKRAGCILVTKTTTSLPIQEQMSHLKK